LMIRSHFDFGHWAMDIGHWALVKKNSLPKKLGLQLFSGN